MHMSNKQQLHPHFDPNSYAVKNGHFIGLPYTQEEATVVILPVPWEATVSYAAGTALGPATILDASYQLDLLDWDIPNAWETPIFMQPVDKDILEQSNQARHWAEKHIDCLEHQKPIQEDLIKQINQASRQLNQWVYEESKTLLEQGKLVGLVGGEHSIPLGYLKALAEKHSDFGILQIDAHCDLRQAYENLTYSHASIFYNILETIPQVTQLVQVGIRDACPAEIAYAQQSKRVSIHNMTSIRQHQYQQQSFHDRCQRIIAPLPQKVYISFDIDGLDPKLCPNTGTPVPEGLEFSEAFYLIQQLVNSGRQLIGFDLCEVGSASEWDGNVGARVLYKLALYLAHFSNQQSS